MKPSQYPDGRLLTAQGEIRFAPRGDLQKGVRQGQLFYVYDVEEMLANHLLPWPTPAGKRIFPNLIGCLLTSRPWKIVNCS